MSLPDALVRRLALPLIAAPMLKASRQELVIEACKQGVIGAFPTANAGGPEGLDVWLRQIQAALGPADAPCRANLIIHRSRTRWAPRAAQAAGADLAYMGTKFIATEESGAAPACRQMLVDSSLDDVLRHALSQACAPACCGRRSSPRGLTRNR